MCVIVFIFIFLSNVVCVSLGSTDSLIEHPASMTHASMSEEMMKKQGLTKVI
jgi:cystathionine beta-lyase/cystathionine gamma-synthase